MIEGPLAGAPARLAEVGLDDKYTAPDGRVLLTGIQALVRVALDQHRADRRAGLHTASLISGYQGSPLGTLDKELGRQRRLIAEHDIHFVPGLNEELAATSVWGSQLTANQRGRRYDGVVGYWYGKNPGLDRAADAIRHANFSGTPPTGGAVALIGDDPSAKSSSLPSGSERMCSSLLLPILFPGTVQEVLDHGLHAVALSRASGLWAAMKIVTNVADAAATAVVGPDRVAPVLPRLEHQGKPYVHVPSTDMLPPKSADVERTMLEARLELARRYAGLNRLNAITHDSRDAWLGIAAPGKAYADLRQALRDLGLGDAELARAGVRILKIGMPWPLERELVRDFAAGLDEVLVVEEKLPFVEAQLRDLLYGAPSMPRVVGERDERDRALLPAAGELNADLVARAVAARLGARVRLRSVEARIEELDRAATPAREALPMLRTPFFCSGCPHNSSTTADDGQLVGAGIGCHTMVLLNGARRGDIVGVTQMGGEGAQWIGMAPFLEAEHFVQNVGDGTFHHSGSLALRAAVAAGVNITYKLLANGAVAMTGGQEVVGGMDIPALTRWLELEGARRVIVTTDEPQGYRGVSLASIASVRPREELDVAQRELAGVPGVTVLIHDQGCAAELRRARKRGTAAEPAQRIVINERVCEGCGDCGEKSNCLSVLPVETEFGRKTRIHQPSCNKDYSCLEGDCPSFISVTPGKQAQRDVPSPPVDLPEPERLVDDVEFVARMIGIGGTGVVTISQVLAMAAHLEGKAASGLDQTGLSQKGGPVLSDLRISRVPLPGVNKVSAGRVDLYLGFDLLGAAAAANLGVADRERTIAVVSTSAVPTGRMVIDAGERFPELAATLGAIEARTRRGANVYLDAQALAERLFDDHMPANMIGVGAAYQRGALPLCAEAIERAIELNGAAVAKSLAAFRWGRACVAAPDAVAALEEEPDEPPELDAAARAIVALAGAEPGSELERLLEIRVPDLIAYQDRGLAERYARAVGELRAIEAERAGSGEATEAVARQLHKLMAYKDEYEVARLHLAERERVLARFGRGAKAHFLLHPPLLRALGLKRKLRLGRWFVPAFAALRAGRRLRGTWLDVFGHTELRRVERALVGEYEALVREAFGALSAANHAVVVELSNLPDAIRGYEDIKLRNVERYRERAEVLRGRLRNPANGRAKLPIVTRG